MPSSSIAGALDGDGDDDDAISDDDRTARDDQM
jgi:hypothetical protein